MYGASSSRRPSEFILSSQIQIPACTHIIPLLSDLVYPTEDSTRNNLIQCIWLISLYKFCLSTSLYLKLIILHSSPSLFCSLALPCTCYLSFFVICLIFFLPNCPLVNSLSSFNKNYLLCPEYPSVASPNNNSPAFFAVHFVFLNIFVRDLPWILSAFLHPLHRLHTSTPCTILDPLNLLAPEFDI
jgi:hypothetical protein